MQAMCMENFICFRASVLNTKNIWEYFAKPQMNLQNLKWRQQNLL